MLQSPARLDAVVQALQGLQDPSEPKIEPQQVLALLLRLEELGLIERVDMAGDD